MAEQIYSPKYKVKLRFTSIFTLLGTIILLAALFCRFGSILFFYFSLYFHYYIFPAINKNWLFLIVVIIGIIFAFSPIYKKIGKFFRNIFRSFKYLFCIKELLESSKDSFYEERPKESLEEDEYGMKHMVERITKAIIEQNVNQKLIIGLNGKLGIGKSTVMNFVNDQLKKEQQGNFVIASVKSWVYKDEKALIEGIFSSLLNSIKRKAGFSFTNKAVKDFIKSMEISLNISPTPYMGSSINLKRQPRDLTIEDARKDFEKRFNEFPWRAIVFIDDLDRCNKEEILLVFKILREFLYIKKFTFIVGYDKEKVESRIDIDIEKYVDLEIPVNIEQNDILNWFYNELSNIKEIREEVKDIYQEGVIKNDFNEILRGYCDTPRKSKLILNELRFSFPVVRDKLYFPHFAMLTIMRRDTPSLYNFLADGGFWILQEGAYELFGKAVNLFEKGVKSLVGNILAKENKKEDRAFEEKIYKYLDFLSYDISYSIITNTGEINPEYKIKQDDYIQKRMERWHDKAIFQKFYTEAYFIWKTPSYAYADSLFDVLLSSINSFSTEEEKIERIRYETERVIDEKKFESFLNLIERYKTKIYELKLNSIFMQGIARIEKYPYELNDKLIKLAASFVPRQPTDSLLEIAKLLIKNAKNPLFLSGVYFQTVLAHSFMYEEDQNKAKEIKAFVENSLKPDVQMQFKEILAKDVKCPFHDFALDVNDLNFFQFWGDAQLIADYLKKLLDKEKNCANKIIYYMRDLSEHVNLYREILQILNRI